MQSTLWQHAANLAEQWKNLERDSVADAKSEHVDVGLTQGEADIVFTHRVAELKSCLATVRLESAGRDDLGRYWRALSRVRLLEPAASPEVVRQMKRNFEAFISQLEVTSN